MKTSTTITGGIAIAACFLTLAWQRNSIGALKREAEGLRDQIEEAPVAANGAANGSHQMGGQQAPAGKRGGPSIEELREMMPGDGEDVGGMEIFALIPEMVKKVEHCDADQLMEVATMLAGDDGSSETKSFEGFFQMLLLIMVGEDDPVRALAYFDENAERFRGGIDLRASLLGELAKQDAKLALSKVEGDGMTPREVEQGRLAIARSLLRTDAAAGLEVLESIKGRDSMPGMSALVAVAGEPAVAASLWDEVNKREPGEIRSDLIEGLLGAAMLKGGGEAVSAEFTKIENLEAGERRQVLKKVAEQFVSMDPAWTIDFVRENSDEGHRPEALRTALVFWAREDYNAAGSWLGEQAPSPERDEMIAGFAQTVAQIDPAAAKTWVEEIQDEELRADAFKSIGPGGAFGSPAFTEALPE